jgi:glutamate--cysteine ligase
MFANSPFTEGKPNGFLSFRSEIWRDTDPDRCGMLPWAFEPGMGFERYVDYALEVPMYFVKRGQHYIDVAGQSFRDLMQGRLPGLPGERATISDWANHISTIFPEVRVKRYLEMRGADGGPWRRLPALPAYWAGILYDDDSLEAAWDLVKNWTAEERQKLRDDVPKLGFAARVAGHDVLHLAKTTIALAEKGLARRRRLDAGGEDERRYLRPIEEYVARGFTAPGTAASSRSSPNMRIEGMSIPYADRVSLPWLFVASLHLDNPAMPDSFRKRSDEVNNAAT